MIVPAPNIVLGVGGRERPSRGVARDGNRGRYRQRRRRRPTHSLSRPRAIAQFRSAWFSFDGICRAWRFAIPVSRTTTTRAFPRRAFRAGMHLRVTRVTTTAVPMNTVRKPAIPAWRRSRPAFSPMSPRSLMNSALLDQRYTVPSVALGLFRPRRAAHRQRSPEKPIIGQAEVTCNNLLERLAKNLATYQLPDEFLGLVK